MEMWRVKISTCFLAFIIWIFPPAKTQCQMPDAGISMPVWVRPMSTSWHVDADCRIPLILQAIHHYRITHRNALAVVCHLVPRKEYGKVNLCLDMNMMGRQKNRRGFRIPPTDCDSPHVLDFVASDYVSEVVSLEELLRDVGAELAADAPLARGPARHRLRVRPQQLAHYPLVWRLAIALRLADVIQGHVVLWKENEDSMFNVMSDVPDGWLTYNNLWPLAFKALKDTIQD